MARRRVAPLSEAQVKRLILAELAQRRDQPAKTLPLSLAFDKQRAYIEDRARKKAVLCPRRSAKTYTIGIDAAQGLETVPGFNALYLGLYFDTARTVMWEPVLKDINHRLDLGWRMNETRLEVTSRMGGHLKLFGADAKPEEIRKALGNKYDRIYIDEAASFRQDLRKMWDQSLKPTLIDKAGTIGLFSTPSDLTKGFYYDITKGVEPGWSVHTWTPRDNPHVRQRWEEDHADLLRENPLVVLTPHYKQMWLGEWCVDDSALVYKFNAVRDTCPAPPPGEYAYVMGVDLGLSDASAFVVCAYSGADKCLYVVHSEAESGLDFTAVAQRIRHLQGRFNVGTTVIDGASAQGVEEMVARHGLSLVRAEKPGKADYQRLLNSDFIQERIKLTPGTEALQKELTTLIWDERALAKTPPKYVEHPSLPNHCCDAFLYAWRYTYAYLGKAPAAPVPQDVAEHRAMFERAINRQTQREREALGDPTDMPMDDPDDYGIY
jgi:hypothetical protein